jgi:hypothetical protein
LQSQPKDGATRFDTSTAPGCVPCATTPTGDLETGSACFSEASVGRRRFPQIAERRVVRSVRKLLHLREARTHVLRADTKQLLTHANSRQPHENNDRFLPLVTSIRYPSSESYAISDLWLGGYLPDLRSHGRGRRKLGLWRCTR